MTVAPKHEARAMVRLELPFPVPLHDCFTNAKGRGRVPTKRYTAYRKEAGLMLMAQRARPVEGPVSVRIQLVAPDKRVRDGDNTLKCIFDTLKHFNIIADDSNRVVIRHELIWVPSGPPCVVLVQEAQESLAA